MANSFEKFGLSQKRLFHFLLILAVCLIAYSNTFKVPFHFDDQVTIVENPIIKELGLMVNPSKAQVYMGNFEYKLFKRRYVAYLTFALNYWMHELDVVGYHLVNISIHIINAMIVYWLMILSFRTPFLNSSVLRAHSNHIALFTSLLFACHPVQTQAVTYIWQRTAILATTFYGISLVMYVKWRLASDKASSFFPRIPLLFYFGSIIAAVLAMKTKEIAFTLPVIILLYELMFFDGELKKRFLYLAPLFLTMFIIPASLLDLGKPLDQLIGSIGQVSKVDDSISRWDYLLTQFTVIVTYIRLIFLPINQNVDYDYPIYDTFMTQEVLLSLLLLLFIFGAGLVMFLHSRNSNHSIRVVAFGIFWFFITLSVESSFIPLMNVIFENRIYLPGLGVSMAFVTGFFLLITRFDSKKVVTLGPSALIVVVVLFSALTHSRNHVWRSEVALWKDCVEKSPQNDRAFINLSAALAKEGRYDEAIRNYWNALRINYNNEKAHSGLGIVLKNLGRIDEAIDHYQKALQIRPDYEKAHNNLGIALFIKGDVKRATSHFRKALTLKPHYTIAKKNLRKVLAGQNEN